MNMPSACELIRKNQVVILFIDRNEITNSFCVDKLSLQFGMSNHQELPKITHFSFKTLWM